MNTKEKTFILSMVGKDIMNHKRAVLANAAHQSLVLELVEKYKLNLKHISEQIHMDHQRLVSLAAGTLDTITLTDYMKLLCFYCFKQTQPAASSITSAPVKEWQNWHEQGGMAPLSIYAKYTPLHKTSGMSGTQERYYLNDHFYLTKREYEVACALFNKNSTYKAIGKALGLSSRTIEYYITNLRTKFNASTRRELKRKLKPIFESDLNGGTSCGSTKK